MSGTNKLVQSMVESKSESSIVSALDNANVVAKKKDKGGKKKK